MARTLWHVRPIDLETPPEMAPYQFAPGMCVTIIEDGQEFGRLDVGPHSRVIEFPGIPAADLADLCAPVSQTEIVSGGGETFKREKLLAIRAMKAKALALLGSKQNLSRSQIQTFLALNFDRTPKPIDKQIIE